MNITRGPMLEAYALLLDISLDDVLAHVNSFVNNGADVPGAEKTEKGRLDQIKKSIQERIDNSITAHIKRDIERMKEAA